VNSRQLGWLRIGRQSIVAEMVASGEQRAERRACKDVEEVNEVEDESWIVVVFGSLAGSNSLAGLEIEPAAGRVLHPVELCTRMRMAGRAQICE